MQGSISSISDIGLMAVLCAMFVIVFVCVQKAVKEMSFFGDAGGLAVSFCVALLSILGLVRFFGSPETAAAPAETPGETSGLLDVVLLPYVALALMILLMLLLFPLGKVLYGRESWHGQKRARSPRMPTEPSMREDNRRPGKVRTDKPRDGKQLTIRSGLDARI